MEYTHLSTTVGIKTISETATLGVFEVEGLFAGYGLTVGNSMRRTLLSSLPGAAVTQLKIRNIAHEFSVLPGVKEDIVELSMNFKKLRFRMHTDEPRVLLLKAKGEKTVTAGDIKPDAEVEVMNPGVVLATLTAKNAELEIEITVERGLGYSAVESRKGEKLAIGVVAIDAYFSPVIKANYTIENMRVGERTDYDRLRFEVETDGTISPSSAIHKAGVILRDHFDKVSAANVQEFEAKEILTGEKEPKKRSRAKKEE